MFLIKTLRKDIKERFFFYLVAAFCVLNLLLLSIFFIVGGYPTIFISLHFISLLVVGFYIFKPHSISLMLRKRSIDIGLLVLLFIVAFSSRLYMLGVVTPGFDGDEIAVARSSQELHHIGYTPFIFNNFGHGTIIPYMVGVSISLFGNTVEAIRLPAVLFGALGVCAFYILLRLFTRQSIAFFLSILFTFSYAHFALSRVIFEPTAAIFFELITIICMILAIRKNELRYYVGVGLFLALGNYTYINFRVFAIFIFIILLIHAIRLKGKLRDKCMPLLITVVIFFASLVPLIHYAINHPDHMTARAKVLSVFHQGLSGREILLTIGGNIAQLPYLFISPGDPNVRINPARTSMFDLITTLFLLLGVIYLIRYKRNLFAVLLFLCIPFIISDALAYESGPANTFYGFAHPNTLRISGIIPIVYMIVAFGFVSLMPFLITINKGFYRLFFLIIVIAIGSYNMFLYFYQDYNGYIYVVNGVRELEMVKFVNSSPQKKLYISPSITSDPRFIYFLEQKPLTIDDEDITADTMLTIISTHELSIIDARKNKEIATLLLSGEDNKLENITKIQYTNSFGKIDALIYIKQ